MSEILRVENLSVVYEPQDGVPVRAVDDVSFSVTRGDFVGLVGESGSGKSTLGFAITRLLRPPARIESGRVHFDGRDIATLSGEELRQARHGGFAMVLQSGMNALNPVRTIGNHFYDVIRAHEKVSREETQRRATELLGRVHLSDQVLSRYPHELSGGMRQRVAIAIALSLQPQLMVFDEPTTALDVLVQQAVIETIQELQRELGFTAVLISHDLGLVLERTDRVMVMKDGVIVESGPSSQVLADPQDAYTNMLLESYVDPRGGAPARAAKERTGWAQTSLVVDGVSKSYQGTRRQPGVQALDAVSFRLDPGEAVGLVGASGSGKSTLARLVTGAERPDAGTVRFGDLAVESLGRGALRDYRRNVQMIFQDPYAALNPLHSVAYTLSRPIANYLGLSGKELLHRVGGLLELVGLTPVAQFAGKLPHQLSGGQRQRVVIARALASEPQVIIADEPVSMLDVSLRADVLSLLEGLRERLGVSLLFITHDLHSARVVTDRTLVLNGGKLVESGPTVDVLQKPADDYTRKLIEAIPNPHVLRS